MKQIDTVTIMAMTVPLKGAHARVWLGGTFADGGLEVEISPFTPDYSIDPGAVLYLTESVKSGQFALSIKPLRLPVTMRHLKPLTLREKLTAVVGEEKADQVLEVLLDYAYEDPAP